MNKIFTHIHLKEIFCFAALLSVNCFVKGQVIQRGEIAIPDSSPYIVTDFIYEEGSAITKLDSGCFAIGGEIVYSTTALQTRSAEQIFICKIDSQFNVLWTDTFMYYNDYNSDHYVQKILTASDQSLVFDADVLLYGYDSLIFDPPFNTFNKQTESGSRVWTKALFPSSSLLNFFISGSINRDDSFLVSGYGYDTIAGNYLPLLAKFDPAGDTIFLRNYSAYVSDPCYSTSKIYEDIEGNIYMTISCYTSLMHYILRLDAFGNVLSSDSIMLGDNNIGFLFITSNRFLAYGTNQNITFFDSAHAVIDSFSMSPGIWTNRFYATQDGSVLGLESSLNSSIPLPDGDYVFKFDTSGHFSGGLLYNHFNPWDFIQAVAQVDDSTYIGTGYALSSNFLSKALVLKFGIQQGVANISAPQSYLCGSESMVISLPPAQMYKWSTGETTQQITVSQPGSYFASIVTGSGTLIFTDTFQVVSYALPIVNLGNDTMLCFTESILLDGGSGFMNYIWQDNSTNQTYIASTSTPDTILYSLSVTDTNGCQNSDSILVIFDVCENIKSLSESSGITIYPDPSNGIIHLSFEKSKAQFQNLSVMDLTGREVFHLQVTESTCRLDLSFLAKGVYQIRFTASEAEPISGRFVIE